MARKYLKKTFQNERFFRLIVVFFLVAIVNAGVIWYVLTQKTVFYWDESGYWTSAIELTRLFRNEFADGVSAIIASLSTDYNYLPIVPIVPIMMLFGNSRVVFIVSILNLYLVPASIGATYLFDKFFMKGVCRRRLFFVTALAATLSLPPVLFPVLSGQVDAVGLPVIVVILWTITRVSMKKTASLPLIVLGVMLCFLVVLRRWYSFWAIAAVLSYIITFSVKICIDARNNAGQARRIIWGALKQLIINISIVGVIAAATLYLLFPYLFNAYLVNYSDLYSAYRGGRLEQVWEFVNHIGFVLLAMAVIGYILVLKMKCSSPLRYTAAFFIVQAVIIYILFTSTQNFSIHHYYLIVPFLVFGVFLLLRRTADSSMSDAAVVMIIILTIVVWLPIYSFGKPVHWRPSSNDLKKEWPLFGRKNGPVVRTDLSELSRLATFVEKKKQPGDTIYVVASSDTFNDSLFRDILLPDHFIGGVINSSHVDKRDGFNNDFFRAKYVIVADPVQTHLHSGQLVITNLAQQIIQGCGRDNLSRVGTFYLDRGVRLTLYERIGKYDQCFVDELRATIKREYGEGYPHLINIRQE